MTAVAVVPQAPELEAAARAGGARIVEAGEADALIWTIPREPQELAAVLATSPARWVQLPFAGIEGFVEAGVVDPARTWTCAKGIYGPSTAEGALALMLAAARRLHDHVRARRWIREAREGDRHRTLAGDTVVLVGTGGIGEALTGMLAPLRARVIAVNRSGRSLAGAAHTERVEALPGLVGGADWVVLACALTPQTRHLVDAALLERMRDDAWLVNVARGGLVDTGALVDALRARAIGGAALDVTEPEPLPDDHPLWDLDEVIITPHVANTWRMAVPELAALIERNVRAFAAGLSLEGLVDPELGY